MPTHDEGRRVTLDVGLDLDGCFYDFAAAYYDACCAMGVIKRDPLYRLVSPATRWEFYEDHGHDLGQFLANCNQAADLGLLWAGPVMPGGKVAWQALVDAGVRVHVKTDRSFGSFCAAPSEVATRMWLHINGLRHETVTFGADKTQGPAVDVMLDDKLANYDALDQAGTQVWLFDRPWNQDPGDNRRRVYSYDEFLTRVDVLARQKALVDA